MPTAGFEWFVAWRHLRDPERRSRRTLAIGLLVVLLGGVAVGVSYALQGRFREGMFLGHPSVFVDQVRLGGIVAILAGGLLTFMGILLTRFTLFTALSIFGVFIGTSFPIVALSVMSGFEMDLKTKIRGAKADVVVTRADDQPFMDAQAVESTLKKLAGVVASTAFIESEVMLRIGANPAGVILRGIDPRTAGGVLDLGRSLREGKLDDLEHPSRVKIPPRWSRGLGAAALGDHLKAAAPSPPDPDDRTLPVVLLGEELYGRNLHVFIGSEVEVVCPLCGVGPLGAMPKPRAFRVAGHFYSGMYEYDSKLAYISLTEAQQFLEMPGEVTGIDVRTAVPEEAELVATAIRAALGPSYDVRSWQELNRGLFMALKLEKIAMFIVLTFIALVASFSVIATLIMLATEKGREIAILKAMGAGDAAVVRMFLFEGLYIGLLGLGAGVSAGIAGCLLIKWFGLPLPTDVYYISRLPIVMRAGEIATVAGIALGLCCLATIYPAYLASRMRPVDGLRYD